MPTVTAGVGFAAAAAVAGASGWQIHDTINAHDSLLLSYLIPYPLIELLTAGRRGSRVGGPGASCVSRPRRGSMVVIHLRLASQLTRAPRRYM